MHVICPAVVMRVICCRSAVNCGGVTEWLGVAAASSVVTRSSDSDAYSGWGYNAAAAEGQSSSHGALLIVPVQIYRQVVAGGTYLQACE